MEDVDEPRDIMDAEREWAIDQRTLNYLKSGDLGKTLNLWRQKEVNLSSLGFGEEGKEWAEWVLWLWMLDYRYVSKVLSQPKIFPILEPDLTHNMVGWFERERCDSLDPEWNSISVAIAHNASETRVGYIYVPCLDQTKIEILSRDSGIRW